MYNVLTRGIVAEIEALRQECETLRASYRYAEDHAARLMSERDEMRAEISRMREGLKSAVVALTKLYPYSTDDEELADLEQTRAAAIAIVRWALGPNVADNRHLAACGVWA